jgi:hypothetical protein
MGERKGIFLRLVGEYWLGALTNWFGRVRVNIRYGCFHILHFMVLQDDLMMLNENGVNDDDDNGDVGGDGGRINVV